MVINSKGKIICIYIPFKVTTVADVNNIPIGSQLYVDAVLPHVEHQIAFLINEQWYPYHCFKILAAF
jgi:hypothetical protein